MIIDPTTLGANAHFDVSLKLDGVDQTKLINFAADDVNYWSENAGDYPADTCIRLAGGYNEWGTKYIDSPSGFTTIEYTITLNLDMPAAAATTDAVVITSYSIHYTKLYEVALFFDRYGKLDRAWCSGIIR